jgi:hypothetical protein
MWLFLKKNRTSLNLMVLRRRENALNQSGKAWPVSFSLVRCIVVWQFRDYLFPDASHRCDQTYLGFSMRIKGMTLWNQP